MAQSTCRLLAFFSVFLIFALPGCSKSDKPEGFPDLYPCEIKIVQDGAPLEGANVTLVGGATWAVGGGTNAGGVAKIHTHGKFDGAPVGKYKVLVTKNVTEGAPTPEQLNDPSYSGDGGSTYNTVDKKFGTQTTTPLEIEITPGSNSETFDVEKAVKDARPQV